MKRALRRAFLFVGVALLWVIGISPRPCSAVEGAAGLYLLGYQSQLMGVLPPPGFYFKNDIYYYNANIGKAVLQGRLDFNLNAALFLDAFNFSYVPKLQLPGGGFYGASLTIPVGVIDLIASASLGSRTASASGSNGGLADMVLSPLLLGWPKGNFHYLFLTNVYMPTGSYSVSRAVNLGKNHFAFDPGFNFTWLDMKSGNEVSLAMGYTINLENTAVQYESGQEFHADFNYMRHFRNGIALGAVGYAYQQTTGDSGAGAILGPFKGRDFGIGPQLSYSTKFKNREFNVDGRYYHEFLMQNHFAGNSFYMTMSYKLF